MICRSVVLFVAFLTVCATCSAAGDLITFGTLVDEMTDLLRLGDYPEPGFRTVQFSSYDRRSNQPGGPGWFANSDGFGNEPIPNFEAVIDPPDDRGVGRYLICDVEGPGAIVRTWTAAIAGTIRVMLDGAEQPIYEGSAQQFLQESYRTWAEIANVDAELFEGSFRQRDACYLPIPFAQRCRIEWIGKTAEIHFYEVQVRRYEVNTNVASFRPQDLQTYSSELKRAAQILLDPQTRWPYRSKLAAQKVDVQIAPGEQVEALQLKGPKAIERLTLKLAADDLDQALRQTVLQVVFDDHSLPQIQSPLGDFFGAAPGVNPFNSAPFTVQEDGRMTCRYVMPFARSCRVMIDNRGSQSVHVVGDVLPVEYDWDDDRSMHFRAAGEWITIWSPTQVTALRTLPTCPREDRGSTSERRPCCSIRIRSRHRTATGGAKATRRSSLTRTYSPRRLAPGRKTTSIIPGPPRIFSCIRIAVSRGMTARRIAVLLSTTVGT